MSATKAELKVLEKMFAREVACALAKSAIPPIFQSKAKIMVQLKEKGLVAPANHHLGGRFPVTISGWLLTHSGRITYCSTC